MPYAMPSSASMSMAMSVSVSVHELVSGCAAGTRQMWNGSGGNGAASGNGVANRCTSPSLRLNGGDEIGCGDDSGGATTGTGTAVRGTLLRSPSPSSSSSTPTSPRASTFFGMTTGPPSAVQSPSIYSSVSPRLGEDEWRRGLTVQAWAMKEGVGMGGTNVSASGSGSSSRVNGHSQMQSPPLHSYRYSRSHLSLSGSGLGFSSGSGSGSGSGSSSTASSSLRQHYSHTHTTHSNTHTTHDTDANDAGARLPRIPRRVASSASSSSTVDSSSTFLSVSTSVTSGSELGGSPALRPENVSTDPIGDDSNTSPNRTSEVDQCGESQRNMEDGEARVERKAKFTLAGSESESGSGSGEGSPQLLEEPNEDDGTEPEQNSTRRKEVTLSVGPSGSFDVDSTDKLSEDWEDDSTTPTLTPRSTSVAPSAPDSSSPERTSSLPGIAQRTRKTRGRSGFAAGVAVQSDGNIAHSVSNPEETLQLGSPVTTLRSASDGCIERGLSRDVNHPATIGVGGKDAHDAITTALRDAFRKMDGSSERSSSNTSPVVQAITTTSPVSPGGVAARRGSIPGAGNLRLDLSASTMSAVAITSPSSAHSNSPTPKEDYQGITSSSILSLSIPLSPVQSQGISKSVSMYATPLIRKKSGEILKSSLKKRSSSTSSSRRPHVNGLSFPDLFGLGLTPPAFGSPSISAPATPTASSTSEAAQRQRELTIAAHSVKAVHFDAQLEHVKLFLAEQKPAAVSRDGSPTLDDTTGESSGGEGSLGFGSRNLSNAHTNAKATFYPESDEESDASIGRSLVIKVLNVPKANPPLAGVGEEVSMCSSANNCADVQLESLKLADDAMNIVGRVCVRNLAFEKRVVVRFTFDNWQTTSEVSAKWVEPLKTKTLASTAQGFDQFAFSIRLSDLLLRIEEKTLMLAVKYTVAGKEIWDNNICQNYKIAFEKRVQTPQVHSTPSSRVDVRQSPSNEKRDDVRPHPVVDGIKDNARSVGVGNGAQSIASNGQRKQDPLVSRYDLAAALRSRSTWSPSLEHAMTWAGRDAARTFNRSSVPWPRKKGTTEISQTGIAQGHSHAVSPRYVPGQNYGKAPNQTYISHGVSIDKSSPVQQVTLGSSREQQGHRPESVFRPGSPFLERCGSDAFDVSLKLGYRPDTNASRNHQRSYFDSWVTGHSAYSGYNHRFGGTRARMTSPTIPNSLVAPHRTLSDPDTSCHTPRPPSPISSNGGDRQFSTSPGRYNSFPPLGSSSTSSTLWPDAPKVVIPLPTQSEISTPSITTVSSPTDTITPSPLSPPESPETYQVDVGEQEPGNIDTTVLDASNYNVFLNK